MYDKLTLSALEILLNRRFKEGFLSLKDLPHPSTFKDMDRATERIADAIKNREKITIIGDYDVDGVTSTTLMKLFFDEIGYPVEWIIPNRFKDGYGLSANIIPRIRSMRTVFLYHKNLSFAHNDMLPFKCLNILFTSIMLR